MAPRLATEVIEEVAGSKMGNKSRLELDVWLDSLFKQGKLVKVHGGDAVGWGLLQGGFKEKFDTEICALILDF